MTQQIKRVDDGRSVHLLKSEIKDLIKYREQFVFEVDCAISIGIDRSVLSRVMKNKSGKPHIIKKVRAALIRGAEQK